MPNDDINDDFDDELDDELDDAYLISKGLKKENVEMGKRIRERREYLKKRNYGRYTQQEVAEMLGMSREGYSHYEAGRNDVSTDTLNKLAKILHVPLTYFYGEIDAEQIALNQKMQMYTGLPPHARKAVDAQIEALAAMFRADDADPGLHGPTVGGSSAE